MRARVVSRLALLWGASVALWSGVAAAQQTDTNPPVPNVLILLDNSGSMERMIDGTIPEATAANACNCTDNGPNVAPTCVFPDSTNPAKASPIPNRWNTVQQALTGYLATQTGANGGFNCVAMPRTPGGTFATEYQIGGVAPYDQNYYLNFHRMVAEDTSTGLGSSATACVVAPGPLPGATSAATGVGPTPALYGGSATHATDYTPGATVTRKYSTFTVPTTECNFTQLTNGAIPSMTQLMRFGLMTFDSDPSAGTGVTAANQVTSPNAFTGMWSYFPGWNTGATCNFSPYAPVSNCSGNPVNCSTLSLMAVGARNPGAPPWEGRMVPLPTPSGLTQAQSNAEVSQVILATRPYGPTPIAGMFTGAQYYFQADPTGPQTDPFVAPTSGTPCRKEFMILLTDGSPNLDLRTACDSSVGDAGAGPGGTCPFNLPSAIATSLYNGGVANGTQQFVTTFVIGFATSSFTNDGGALINCPALVTSGTLATNCAPVPNAPLGSPPMDPTYAPCCALEQIAQAGGSGHAYFAATPQDLQNALGSILATIGSTSTSRTVPTFSPVLTAGSASMFNAWLYPNIGAPWSGDITRTTYSCPAAVGMPAVMNAPSVANGDDFASNLNKGPAGLRQFYVLQPANAANTVHDGSQSIRPYAPAAPSDGEIFETSTQSSGVATTVIPDLTYDALGIPVAGQPYTPVTGTGVQEYLNQSQTRNMILDFIFGQQEPALPTDFGWVSRCILCGAGNTGAPATSSFGDIYHATPVVVGPPDSLLDDISYSGFRTYITTTAGGGDGGTSSAPRAPVVYAATNDGLLHAFATNENANANNELWAMLLPAPEPLLLSTYPATDQFLLDGAPVVKDVVWDRTTINASMCASGQTVTRPPPDTGETGCPWHTSLVAGYGASQQGYYSVDVTNPTSPVFEWQLTKMVSPNFSIFGSHSATPAITTITLNDSSGAPHEVGVAILPGGVNAGGPTSTTASCERIHVSSGTGTDSEPASSFVERNNVRCWGTPPVASSPVPGRSLSIVRLDTGEIVRVFARKTDISTTNATDPLLTSNAGVGVVTDTQLDSPMTGTPVVYPSDVGADATKIFVGDADGTVWRFDVSSPNPAQWFGDAFIDLYNQTVDTSATSWNDGQPFDVPMVASLDSTGSLVLNIASGTTQTFDTTGIEYLYSVSEKVGGSPTRLRASVNWYWIPMTPAVTTTPSFLQQGERVAGPMTVFNGTLYFATYYAGTPSTGCNPGRAKLWGFNFNTPQNTSNLSQGGLRPAATSGSSPTTACTSTQDWTDPGVACGVIQSSVVPGVAVLATPACAQAGTAAFGSTGVHNSLSSVAAGGFSLVANVGGSGVTGGTSVSMALPTPTSPTVIDSWASVVE